MISSIIPLYSRGCDHCEEWYHGDCIGVTDKDAKYIKKFYCKECREKNKHLSVVYKSKYADKIKEMNEKASKEKKHKEKDRDKEKKKKKYRDREKDRDRDKDQKKHRDSESRDKHKHKHKDKDRDRDLEKDKVKDKERDYDREKERNKDREKEKEKQKIKEEIKEEKTSNEPIAKEEKLKEEPYKIKKIIKDEDEKSKKVEPVNKRLEEVKRERSKSIDKKEPPEKQRKVLAVKDVDNISKYSSEDDWDPPAKVVSVPAPPKPVKEKVPAGVKRKASKDVREATKKRKGWRQARRDSSDDSDTEVDLTPRQCENVDCINTARVGSKYCSDQCGLSLASFRIYQTLPERIREWNLTSCKAAETNTKELVRIRAEINTAREKLEEVDREVEKLEQLISKVKKISPVEKDSDDSSDDDEEKVVGVINCISCGKDISSKLAIRHMESCFNKFESQTSYGSLYKTNIEGYEMVCDFYNPQTGVEKFFLTFIFSILICRNIL